MKINSLRIPCLDLKLSEQFYSKLLGFKKVFGSVSDGFVGYQLDNVQILLELEEKGEFECGRFLGFSIEVEDISTFYSTLYSKGVQFTGPPEPQFWGAMMTHIVDINGNSFSIVQPHND